jgi:hypothetical protein
LTEEVVVLRVALFLSREMWNTDGGGDSVRVRKPEYPFCPVKIIVSIGVDALYV